MSFAVSSKLSPAELFGIPALCSKHLVSQSLLY